MDFTTIDAYLNLLPDSDDYTKLAEADRRKKVFGAEELLKDHFSASSLTDRAVSLQVLYMLEGEAEEFSKYKRHGIKSFATKGLSLSFEGSGVSPDVINLLKPNKASVRRLI
ncbi:hypothetical protein BKM15_25935 [Pseudomonas syringae pv. syringae]|nr:hypothetical protein BKM15_25935 [Pseudomonas syringae pv. syringae]